jgi:hypothetical protein
MTPVRWTARPRARLCPAPSVCGPHCSTMYFDFDRLFHTSKRRRPLPEAFMVDDVLCVDNNNPDAALLASICSEARRMLSKMVWPLRFDASVLTATIHFHPSLAADSSVSASSISAEKAGRLPPQIPGDTPRHDRGRATARGRDCGYRVHAGKTRD